MPIIKIVAEAEVVDVIMLPPEQLWEETKHLSGISKSFFDKYFKGRQTAYAYKLGKVTVYKEPKTLVDFGVNSAPQSFIYVWYLKWFGLQKSTPKLQLLNCHALCEIKTQLW